LPFDAISIFPYIFNCSSAAVVTLAIAYT